MQGNPATENQRIHRGRYGPAGSVQGGSCIAALYADAGSCRDAGKDIVSLYDMCFDDEGHYDISTRDEKITDSLNYLFLLKAIVKEGDTD